MTDPEIDNETWTQMTVELNPLIWTYADPRTMDAVTLARAVVTVIKELDTDYLVRDVDKIVLSAGQDAVLYDAQRDGRIEL